MKETTMRIDRVLTLALTLLLSAGVAGADFKIVQAHHQDGFSMMGQNQPETNEEHVTWIGDDALRMDQGSTTTIVRADQQQMLIVNHDDETFTSVELPIDLNTLLPPGMGEQMLKMMQFDVTVTPTDETKMVGDWEARRYNLELTSSMMSMSSVLWASTDTPIVVSDYFDLYSQILRLQPGMDAMIDKMKQIDGYVVEQEATMTMSFMGETTIGSSDRVLSIDEIDPPAGTYDPPAGYTREEFDYMSMMQDQ
jgi:hypothetical protein